MEGLESLAVVRKRDGMNDAVDFGIAGRLDFGRKQRGRALGLDVAHEHGFSGERGVKGGFAGG